MKPVVYACIPLLVLNTVSAASAQNFTPDEMKANMERMFALDLPEDCPEFRESEEAFNHSAMKTGEINALFRYRAICSLQKKVEQAAEQGEIDAVSNYNFRSALFSMLAFNSCDWGVGPDEHFEWCDRLDELAPSLNEVHFQYYRQRTNELNLRVFPDVDESLLQAVQSMPIDEESCRLDDGSGSVHVENRDGLLTCSQPEEYRPAGFYLSDTIYARDFNHDGVMDLGLTLSYNGGGTLTVSHVLIVTRRDSGEPFKNITYNLSD